MTDESFYDEDNFEEEIEDHEHLNNVYQSNNADTSYLDEGFEEESNVVSKVSNYFGGDLNLSTKMSPPHPLQGCLRTLTEYSVLGSSSHSSLRSRRDMTIESEIVNYAQLKTLNNLSNYGVDETSFVPRDSTVHPTVLADAAVNSSSNKSTRSQREYPAKVMVDPEWTHEQPPTGFSVATKQYSKFRPKSISYSNVTKVVRQEDIPGLPHPISEVRRRGQKIEECQTGRTAAGVSEDEILGVLRRLLETAACATEQQAASHRLISRRAVLVPNMLAALPRHCLDNQQVDSVSDLISSGSAAVPEYDPDYLHAQEFHSSRKSPTKVSQSSASSSGSASTSSDTTRHRYPSTVPKVEVSLKPSGIPRQVNRQTSSRAIPVNDIKPAADVLRAGTELSFLKDKSEQVYANFVNDIIGVCKSRASLCATVEEIAMHRVLCEHLNQTLIGHRQVEAVRRNMVAAAIDSSLKFKS